jgi:UDP-N-acetylglucosamine diphosphorylase/glucosamine-1-phosphate N-acetyltransferase
MKICIFEDSAVSNLSPVNYLRHTSDLLCGVYPLHVKVHRLLRSKFDVVYHCRNYTENYFRSQNKPLRYNNFPPDDYLFLNSRIIYTQKFIDGLFLTLKDIENCAFVENNTIIAFHVNREKLKRVAEKLTDKKRDNLLALRDLQRFEIKTVNASEIDHDISEELTFINFPSDLLVNFSEELKNDLGKLFNKKTQRRPRTRADLINEKNIYISPDCAVNSHVVINASKGPVFISESCIIEPFTYIEGPVFIGENTTLRSGTKLYGPVRIGDWCKVSGEITGSVIHSYVNKQHLGFLGNSYLCEWVNLGAGTTTSNLKNNYSKIVMDIDGKNINSGTIFLGSIIGDHTKTGINSMLNTGTLIGISCNIYGGDYQPKHIPSFSWSQAGKPPVIYEITKAVKTASISMKRRNVEITNDLEELMLYYYKKTHRYK